MQLKNHHGNGFPLGDNSRLKLAPINALRREIDFELVV
jgi:hypothetical protein